MQRFRMDNTEGYTQNDLDELNQIWDKTLEGFENDPIPEDIRKSFLDFLSEQILSKYDLLHS
jgi:hypothetical protein